MKFMEYSITWPCESIHDSTQNFRTNEKWFFFLKYYSSNHVTIMDSVNRLNVEGNTDRKCHCKRLTCHIFRGQLTESRTVLRGSHRYLVATQAAVGKHHLDKVFSKDYLEKIPAFVRSKHSSRTSFTCVVISARIHYL